MGPNVALVMFDYPILGGAERRMFDVCRRLTARNYHLHLIITSEMESKLRKIHTFADLSTVSKSVVWTPLSLAPNQRGWLNRFNPLAGQAISIFNWIALSIQLWKELRRCKAQLVHLILNWSVIAFWPLRFFRFSRLPYVLSFVGDDIRELENYSRTGSLNRLAASIIHNSSKEATVIELIGPDLFEAVRRLTDVDLKKCLLPRTYVDSVRFSPSRRKRPWVVFAHRLVPSKNPLLFVEAIPAVRKKHPHARFFVLGEGPLLDNVRSRVRELGINENTEVRFERQIERILSHSLVFVSLQDKENYSSQSMMEAMASGNAIVATDVGYTYTVVNDSTGLRIQEGNRRQLSNSICLLLDDPSRCKRLGQNGRSLMSREYYPAQYIKHVEKMYARALTVSSN